MLKNLFNNKVDLYELISNDNITGIYSYLRKGGNPDLLDEYGQTPLFRVVYNESPNQIQMLKALLEYKANPNHKHPEDESTPLYHSKSRKVAELLVDYGADLNQINKLGHNHLHNCYSIEMIEFYLEKGLDINEKNNLGSTPIFNAVHFGYDLVKFLIENRAKVELKNNNGWTPLISLARTQYATQEDNIEIKKVCDLLINNGAKINTKDILNKDSIDHAKEMENIEFAEYLSKIKRKHNTV